MAEGKQAKVSKASVNYRMATGRRVCGSCDMYHCGTPFIGECDLVRGVIEARDVCNEWVNTGAARSIRGYPYQSHNEPKSKGG